MKKSLIFALALMLVLAFATSAMAAQVINGTPGVDPAENVTYSPTAVQFVYYDKNNPSAYEAAYLYNNGIYLPNAYSPVNYRIHTGYTKNTDACASCHSTHTAVGNSLLQWNSLYDTCMACHDGTVTTTYDVVNGEIGNTGDAAMGGAFGTFTELGSDSVHGITDNYNDVKIAAAPGGSTVGVEGKSWDVSFGCQSCHTPHGNGGNARILHPNPNNVAVDSKKASYSVNAAAYVIDGTKKVYILQGYPYTTVIKKGSTVVKEAYISNDSGVSQVVYSGGVDDTFTVEGTPALQVEMNITDYLGHEESVQHISGMNAFCGACHTDYNTEGLGHTSDKDTGTYSKAHRHQVGTAPRYNTVENLTKAGMVLEGTTGNGTLECLTCHVAHGVNESYWSATIGDNSGLRYLADTELKELAGSSALKRIPNMGTCEACHQKGISNQGYTTNSSTTIDTFGIANASGATFVGSANCKSCHSDIYATYQNTAHSQMQTRTTAEDRDRWYTFLVGQGYANGTDVTGGVYIEMEDVSTAVYKFYKEDFKYNVSWDKKNTIIALSKNPGDSNGKLYLLYEDKIFTEPEEYTCINCHSTPKGVANSNYADFEAKIAAGTVELGIQCEDSGCHGNGSKHIASPSANTIINPGNLSIQAQSGSTSCGLCHSSAGHNGEFWKAVTPKGFPGSPDTHFIGPSPMYTASIASCITCHDPHANKIQDISRNGVAKVDLQLKMEVRALCNSCHPGRLITKENFDKYLPLKANGMPSHLFNGNQYMLSPEPTRDHRTVSAE